MVSAKDIIRKVEEISHRLNTEEDKERGIAIDDAVARGEADAIKENLDDEWIDGESPVNRDANRFPVDVQSERFADENPYDVRAWLGGAGIKINESVPYSDKYRSKVPVSLTSGKERERAGITAYSRGNEIKINHMPDASPEETADVIGRHEVQHRAQDAFISPGDNVNVPNSVDDRIVNEARKNPELEDVPYEFISHLGTDAQAKPKHAMQIRYDIGDANKKKRMQGEVPYIEYDASVIQNHPMRYYMSGLDPKYKKIYMNSLGPEEHVERFSKPVDYYSLQSLLNDYGLVDKDKEYSYGFSSHAANGAMDLIPLYEKYAPDKVEALKKLIVELIDMNENRILSGHIDREVVRDDVPQAKQEILTEVALARDKAKRIGLMKSVTSQDIIRMAKSLDPDRAYQDIRPAKASDAERFDLDIGVGQGYGQYDTIDQEDPTDRYKAGRIIIGMNEVPEEEVFNETLDTLNHELTHEAIDRTMTPEERRQDKTYLVRGAGGAPIDERAAVWNERDPTNSIYFNDFPEKYQQDAYDLFDLDKCTAQYIINEARRITKGFYVEDEKAEPSDEEIGDRLRPKPVIARNQKGFMYSAPNNKIGMGNIEEDRVVSAYNGELQRAAQMATLSLDEMYNAIVARGNKKGDKQPSILDTDAEVARESTSKSIMSKAQEITKGLDKQTWADKRRDANASQSVIDYNIVDDELEAIDSEVPMRRNESGRIDQSRPATLNSVNKLPIDQDNERYANDINIDDWKQQLPTIASKPKMDERSRIMRPMHNMHLDREDINHAGFYSDKERSSHLTPSKYATPEEVSDTMTHEGQHENQYMFVHSGMNEDEAKNFDIKDKQQLALFKLRLQNYKTARDQGRQLDGYIGNYNQSEHTDLITTERDAILSEKRPWKTLYWYMMSPQERSYYMENQFDDEQLEDFFAPFFNSTDKRIFTYEINKLYNIFGVPKDIRDNNFLGKIDNAVNSTDYNSLTDMEELKRYVWGNMDNLDQVYDHIPDRVLDMIKDNIYNYIEYQTSPENYYSNVTLELYSNDAGNNLKLDGYIGNYNLYNPSNQSILNDVLQHVNALRYDVGGVKDMEAVPSAEFQMLTPKERIYVLTRCDPTVRMNYIHDMIHKSLDSGFFDQITGLFGLESAEEYKEDSPIIQAIYSLYYMDVAKTWGEVRERYNEVNMLLNEEDFIFENVPENILKEMRQSIIMECERISKDPNSRVLHQNENVGKSTHKSIMQKADEIKRKFDRPDEYTDEEFGERLRPEIHPYYDEADPDNESIRTFYDSVPNEIFLSPDDDTASTTIDSINHELQHAAQHSGVHEDDIEYVDDEANYMQEKRKLPFVEADALLRERRPSVSSWFKLASPEQRAYYQQFMQRKGKPKMRYKDIQPTSKSIMQKAKDIDSILSEDINKGVWRVVDGDEKPNSEDFSNNLNPDFKISDKPYTFDPNAMPGSYYDPAWNRIYLGLDANDDRVEGIINHELQHAAQHAGLSNDQSRQTAYTAKHLEMQNKLPVVEGDAVMTEKKPMKSSWWKKGTPEQKEHYEANMTPEQKKYKERKPRAKSIINDAKTISEKLDT